MLIPSPRHTAADLSLWAELEEADRLHYEIGRVRAALAVAASAWVREFVRRGPCYCGVSWGKDSTALAAVVRDVAPDVPLVWFRVMPIRNPDCEAVRDEYRRLFPGQPYYEFETWCTRDADGWHATGTLEAGIKKACIQFGTDRRLSGVRGSESSSRTLSARTHGPATEVSCRPLLDWSAADVYAFLAGRGLPVHPAYAMLGGGRWDRNRIRVSSLGGRRGDGIGRAEWEREYYGDILRRLEAAG